MQRVETERRGATALVRFGNPPGGFMDAQGSAEMLAAVEGAVADPAVRVLVLTGGQRGVFIRHYDVSEIIQIAAAVRSGAAPAEGFETGVFARLTDAIFAAPKPVIAAIDGVCMGGGFEIALACDLRVAGGAAGPIGLPETRIGIFPGGGGTQRLPRLVGEARALEMILRGLTFDAPGALAAGLVHETAPDALARALEIAGELALRPAEGLALAKRLTRAALDRPLSTGLADERRSFAEVLRAESATTAMTAFVEGGSTLDRA